MSSRSANVKRNSGWQWRRKSGVREFTQSRAHAKQVRDLNRMRGMQEDDTNAKKRAMLKSIQEQNLLLVLPRGDELIG